MAVAFGGGQLGLDPAIVSTCRMNALLRCV